MKKKYVSPKLEIKELVLSTSILEDSGEVLPEPGGGGLGDGGDLDLDGLY